MKKLVLVRCRKSISAWLIPMRKVKVGVRSLLLATEADKYKLPPAKFRREYEMVLPKGLRTPINFPILRYTDVLLMYAEATNAIEEPTAEVVDIVNRVRRRCWSKGINSIKVSSAGSGYSSAPTVTFSGGGGSGAKATATINAAGLALRSTVISKESKNMIHPHTRGENFPNQSF